MDPASRKGARRSDFAFSVSSEGELEQALPLIKDLLGKEKLIEIIYTSESVEEKVAKLFSCHPKGLRTLRLPLLSYPSQIFSDYSVKKWISSPKIIFCRYDFYPELLLLKNKKEFLLISGSLKGKEKALKKRGVVFHYYLALFSLFEKFIVATPFEVENFKNLGVSEGKISVMDFRVRQIKERQKDKEKIDLFNDLFDSSLLENRVILGSVWPSEMKIFSSIWLQRQISERKLIFAVAPHKLSNDFISEMTLEINRHAPNLKVYVLNETNIKAVLNNEFKEDPGVLIIKVAGVLCELYTEFSHAFVGGGHDLSIHSVLEPFLASCTVYCGPKTHRSTEYDYILSSSPDSLYKVDQLEEFALSLKDNLSKDVGPKKETCGLEKTERDFKEIVDEFVIC